jgi:hypothetical protein
MSEAQSWTFNPGTHIPLQNKKKLARHPASRHRNRTKGNRRSQQGALLQETAYRPARRYPVRPFDQKCLNTFGRPMSRVSAMMPGNQSPALYASRSAALDL